MSLRCLATGLLALLLLSGNARAEMPAPLKVSRLDALPLTLNGVPAFLPADQYEPLYFCVFSNIPVELPTGTPDEVSFHLAYGMLGISRDAQSGGYAVKQLKVFLSQNKAGVFEPKTTERTFFLKEEPLQDDSSALSLASDEKAADNNSERRTELHLDKTTGQGYIRNITWSSSDRQAKPSFDFRYPLTFSPISIAQP